VNIFDVDSIEQLRHVQHEQLQHNVMQQSHSQLQELMQQQHKQMQQYMQRHMLQ